MSTAATLDAYWAHRMADVHTALGGVVESYDASAQTARVRPLSRRIILAQDEEGEDEFEELPVLEEVRVLHPGGASWAIHAPISAGDGVLVVVLEQDIAAWLRSGSPGAPDDYRRFSLAHCVALPGLRRQAITGASSDNLTIHAGANAVVTLSPSRLEVHGSTSQVALAAKIDNAFNALANAVVGPQGGGAALQTALRGVWPPGGSTTCASSKLYTGG